MGSAYFHFHYQFERASCVRFGLVRSEWNGMAAGGDCKKAFNLIMLAINCRFISANPGVRTTSGTLIKCRPGAWPTFSPIHLARNYVWQWLWLWLWLWLFQIPSWTGKGDGDWSVCSWNTQTNHFPFRPVIVASVKCAGNDLHKFSNGTLYWQNQALAKQSPHTRPRPVGHLAAEPSRL